MTNGLRVFAGVLCTAKGLLTCVASILLVMTAVCAQELPPPSSSQSTITVTAAATADSVRFTAPSTVVQMRIEVYASNGEKLFDNEIRGGNVIDWHLQDGQAERLSDGSYLCVVTSKSLSGRMNQKLGKITVENAMASVQSIDATQFTAQQTQAVGPLEENSSLTVLKEDDTQTATVIAHNGKEGQLIRGRGALSFRIGDFFSGKDTEQMRLTPEGNLGIGISHPQARLDVDGLIRTSQGIIFPDGTMQTTAALATSAGQTPDQKGPGGELFKSINQNKSSGKAGKNEKGVSPELFVNEDLTVNGNIIFTTPLPQAFQRDITMQDNNGGLRFFGAPSLTTTPAAAAIQFWGTNSPFQGQLYLDSGAHNNSAVIIRTTGTGGTITERMRVTATGNTGIGATAPRGRLEVIGNGANVVIGDPGCGAGSNTVAIGFLSSTGPGLNCSNNFNLGAGMNAGGETVINRPAGGQISFREGNGPDQMRINSGGNVGIGTTGPLGRLQVVTTNDTAPGNIPAWDSRHFVIGTAASSGGIGLSYDQTHNVGYIEALSPSFAWRNLILQSGGGNVGIGSTNPAGTLHVRGASPVRILGDPSILTGTAYVDFMAYSSQFSSDLGGMRIQRQSNGDIDTIFLTAAVGSPATPKVRIRGDGNVGIGTTTPTSTLTVLGTIETTFGGYKFPDGTIQTTASSVSHDGFTATGAVPDATADSVVLSKTVPAGSYLIHARVILTANDRDSQWGNCRLSTGERVDIQLGGQTSGTGIMVIPLLDSATFGSSTDITMHCNGYKWVVEAKLVAIRVDTLR